MNIEKWEFLSWYNSVNTCLPVRPVEKMKEIGQEMTGIDPPV
jgi:hypothetical protein